MLGKFLMIKDTYNVYHNTLDTMRVLPGQVLQPEA